MKIINYEAEKGSEAKTALILRGLEHIVCKHEYLLPRGWRFILKMQRNDAKKAYYHLDVQGDKGGGSFAEVKMLTLESFPECAATGNVDFSELIKTLSSWSGTDEYKKICALDNLDLISKDMAIWLRDYANFTHYQGGIRVPYKDKIIEGNEISDEFGEIRMSFSGGSQEQDIFFESVILRDLNNSFINLYPHTQGWIDLSKLQEIPAIKLWLDLLGIEES